MCGVLRVLLYREGMNRMENMCSPRPSLPYTVLTRSTLFDISSTCSSASLEHSHENGNWLATKWAAAAHDVFLAAFVA